MGMDTEEMYRRGVADAEHGDPHPFYYQHYYQYRRGYDRTRRKLGLPGGFEEQRRRQRQRLLAIAGALLAIAGALFLLRGRTPVLTARPPEPSAAALAATLVPTRTPIFATPTPVPTATPVVLHQGGTATIANTQGAPLRGRKQPGVKAPVAANFKEGEQVHVLEGPVEADGFTWWRIEGQSGTGWSAERSKEGVVWLAPAQ